MMYVPFALAVVTAVLLKVIEGYNNFKAFKLGNWGAEKVFLYTPYLEGDKFTILQDGEVLCKELYLDFDEVYSRTNTSYKPIMFIERSEVDKDERSLVMYS